MHLKLEKLIRGVPVINGQNLEAAGAHSNLIRFS